MGTQLLDGFAVRSADIVSAENSNSKNQIESESRQTLKLTSRLTKLQQRQQQHKLQPDVANVGDVLAAALRKNHSNIILRTT